MTENNDVCPFCAEDIPAHATRCEYCGESWGRPTRDSVLRDQGVDERLAPDLDELVLSYVRGAELSGACLGGVDLFNANLAAADLRGADLHEANLSEADLSGADLSRANLVGADLSYANLCGADLSSAYLRDADLSGALYNGATRWPVGFDPRLAGAIEGSQLKQKGRLAGPAVEAPRGGDGVPHEVVLCEVESGPTAVVRSTVRIGPALGDTIIHSLDQVHHFLRESGVRQAGYNIALYVSREEDDQVDLEAGVQVAESFQGDGPVSCSETPRGRAATTVHWGPYEQLPRAHQAVRAWCAEQGLAIRGTNWEVYGHWDANPARRRTDVYYALDSGE